MTPHFKASELSCRCGCGFLPAADFMQKVESLRVACGFPLPVSSAARCPAHNTAVSSTGATGPHTTGRAIDLAVSRSEAFLLLQHAMASGEFNGIGVAQKGASRFIHLDDVHTTPTIWSYP